jgi:hypothetical protein
MTSPTARDYLQHSVDIASGPVFHYTSAAGLLSAVERGYVWASEAASLNDVAEVRQGWKAIRTLLSKRGPSDSVDLLKAIAKRPVARRQDVFMLCASTRGDDANQWRLYGNDGRGYALEFDAQAPLAVLTKEQAPEQAPLNPPNRRIVGMWAGEGVTVTPWLQVMYRKRRVANALDALIGALDVAMAAAAKISDPQGAEFAYDGINDGATEALATIAHLVKSPGFSGENEVRIVVTFDVHGPHVRFRQGIRGIVGYVHLTAAGSSGSTKVCYERQHTHWSVPLKSIRTGPLLGSEHKKSVESMLRGGRVGSIKVTRSQVPLR